MPMRKQKFCSELGVTAACSLRLLIESSHCGISTKDRQKARSRQSRHLLLADSWFGSVRLAETIKLLQQYQLDNGTFEYKINDRSSGANPKGNELIAAVKTNHAFFPKKEIDKKMKDWPSGSYIVMETVSPESNIPLYAIGYKYNASKVLCFIMTENAGSTVPGSRPYKAKYPDKHGNVCERRVLRPEVISTYFEYSNVIDSHNHLRQHCLGLERYWRTTNPWFRNDCTIIGMTAIDCLKAIRYHCPHLRNMTVQEYADRLAYDCVNNPYTEASTNPRGFIPVAEPRRNENQDPSFVFGSSNRGGVSTSNAWGESVLDSLTLNCCGISPISSVGLGSAGSSNTNSFFAADHDVRPQRCKDASGRAAKRRCVICGMETRNECGNPVCMKDEYEYDGTMYRGVALCSTACQARTHTTKYGPNNTQKCVQIHRQIVKQKLRRGW